MDVWKPSAEGGADVFERTPGLLGKWKDAIFVPPKQEQAFFQGGAFIFSGGSDGDSSALLSTTVYAHYDEATAAHAVPNEMVDRALEAAGATPVRG